MISLPLPEKIKNNEAFWLILTSASLFYWYLSSGNRYIVDISWDYIDHIVTAFLFLFYVFGLRYIAIPFVTAFSSLADDIGPAYKLIISGLAMLSMSSVGGHQPIYPIILFFIVGISVWFPGSQLSAWLVILLNGFMIFLCATSIIMVANQGPSRFTFIGHTVSILLFGYNTSAATGGTAFYLALILTSFSLFFILLDIFKNYLKSDL